MKEKGYDGAEFTGMRVATDGWHTVEFQDGIDYLPGKGGEGIWQDEKTGAKAYKFPIKVVDDDDDNKDVSVDQIVVVGRDGKKLVSMVAAVGLLEAIEKKFGEDASIFDSGIIEGLKVKLPGMKCMMKTERNKDESKALMRQIASFKMQKELAAKEGSSGKASAAQKDTSKSAPASAPAEDPCEDPWA